MISVVIPAYNVEAYVEACLRSVVGQTHADWQAIVVDDGSTDRTAEAVERFCAEDPRITLLRQENQGVSAARRRGLAHSTGQWIMFADADDTLEPTAMEELLLSAEGHDIVVSGASASAQMAPAEHIAALVRGEQSVVLGALHGKLLRRELFADGLMSLPRDIVTGEDHVVNLRLAGRNKRPVRLVKRRLYNYTPLREGSVTREFRFTTPYCQRLYALIAQATPPVGHEADLVTRRLDMLLTLWHTWRRPVWRGTTFLRELRADIKRHGISLRPRQRLLVWLPLRPLLKIALS